MDQRHGGDIDAARARFGGEDWIDLSTGINRVPWQVPAFAPEAWQPLPTRAASESALSAARAAYGTDWPGAIVAGAQAAIDILPRLTAPGRVCILSPTYSEHGIAFARADWQVDPVTTLEALAGAEAAVVVSPNNPDGRSWPAASLRDVAGTVGLMVIDESFMDPTPEASILRGTRPRNTLVLRSLGKFYGLAGARVGFAFGDEALIAALRAEAGPWPVAGPSLELAQGALRDADWAAATRKRLSGDAPRLDALAKRAGWLPLGGSPLFRLYETGDARAAQERLARARLWSRRFDHSPGWLRLGLPGGEGEWARVTQALAGEGK